MGWLNNDVTYLLLKKMLDVCTLRHRIIANNIANVDTPGYKRTTVIFEEKLRSLLKRGLNAEKIREIQPQIYIDETSTWREDFNNVDIEKEMVRLSTNTLRYSIYAQLIEKKLQTIKQAIKGK
ncbi:flagellar basal body rod protein FlgB [Candidatus Aerophobetes bacterium]|uniref:Flagellar basal body rod protein FlgB n=1 Tax=Aerophobetes bacterium TaxID=2030807 RepID=A0A662DGI0_UNCAE|nr:MAG: flagellar basal body rod protein FlgB [Candidatus Aerophobetes bacterium]